MRARETASPPLRERKAQVEDGVGTGEEEGWEDEDDCEGRDGREQTGVGREEGCGREGDVRRRDWGWAERE